VSDNGAQFIAAEFKDFCRMNDIRYIQTAPYHPSSNGMAERAVQVVKQGNRKQSTGTLNDKISQVLFQYHITPHSTTGSSPSELLMVGDCVPGWIFSNLAQMTKFLLKSSSRRYP